MIDHSSRRTKPVVSETTLRYDCVHGTSFVSVAAQNAARDVGTSAVGDRARRCVEVSIASAVPMKPGGGAAGMAPCGSSPRRGVDVDRELAADAEVSWLLRHAAAAATPGVEPPSSSLQTAGDAPLKACVTPDFDQLPSRLATLLPAASWCGLRPPSGATVSHRPCLNFDKMQVYDNEYAYYIVSLMIAASRIVAAAQIYAPYSSGGANAYPI